MERTRGARALQPIVIVREALRDESKIGVFEELLVLIAVEVESARDGHVGADDLAKATCDFSFGPGDPADRERSVQR